VSAEPWCRLYFQAELTVTVIVTTGCGIAPASCKRRLGFVMENGKFRPLTGNQHPSTTAKKFVRGDYVGDRLSQIQCKSANGIRLQVIPRQQIFALDASNNTDSREGIFPLGTKPQKTFESINRRSLAQLSKILKLMYYRNYCIDSNQTLHRHKTTKCTSWVVQIRKLQIQDGGQPPYWRNRQKFDRMTHSRLLKPIGRKN